MLIKCLGAVALTGAAAMTLIQPANATATAQGTTAVQAKANHWGKGMYYGSGENKQYRSMFGEVSGAHGAIWVRWDGTKVGIDGWVKDLSRDGLGPVLQVGYRYGSRGAYTQRYLAKAPNGYGHRVRRLAYSLVPVWDLHARICTLKRGRFVNCTPWH